VLVFLLTSLLQLSFLHIRILSLNETLICDNFIDIALERINKGLNTNGTWTFTESFYFTWVTMASIGYGDYYQTNPEGLVLVCFLGILGVGYFSLVVNKCSRWVEKHVMSAFKLIRKMTVDLKKVKDDEEEEAEEEEEEEGEGEAENENMEDKEGVPSHSATVFF